MSYGFDIDEVGSLPDSYFPMSMSQLAKRLAVGRNRFLTFLRDEGVLHPNNEPGWASEDDWFVQGERTVADKLLIITYVTKKGALEIKNLVLEYGRDNIQKFKVYKPDDSSY